MEDWEIVSIEAELDRLRDERTENESQLTSSQTRTASSSKTGCLMSIIYFAAGIALLRIIGELLSNL
jgi:hypothetical protein